MFKRPKQEYTAEFKELAVKRDPVSFLLMT